MAQIGFKLDRFEHKWSGYRVILTSSEVQSMLEKKGQRIRQAIEVGEMGDDWEVIVSPRIGRTRARVLVSGVPMWLEKSRGILGSAIDAGRG